MRICFLLLLLSSCSIFFGGKDGPKSAKGSLYTISFEASEWHQKEEKRSDYIFENIKDGRILLSNSFCEEFQETPLKELANKTFETVKDFKTLAGKYTTFQNREAYDLIGNGFVDGVKVNLRILNTRRDNCYFDFVSITPDIVDAEKSSFDQFLKSVEFK